MATGSAEPPGLGCVPDEGHVAVDRDLVAGVWLLTHSSTKEQVILPADFREEALFVFDAGGVACITTDNGEPELASELLAWRAVPHGETYRTRTWGSCRTC